MSTQLTCQHKDCKAPAVAVYRVNERPQLLACAHHLNAAYRLAVATGAYWNALRVEAEIRSPKLTLVKAQPMQGKSKKDMK